MKKWRIGVNPGKKNTNGFILGDLVIGISILVVALIFLSLAFRQSVATTVTSRDYYQGLYYANQALEQLKVHDGTSYAAKTTTQWAATWNTGPLTLVAANGFPSYSVQTSRMTGTDEPAVVASLSTQVKTVLVPVRATVSWVEFTGAAPITKSVSVVGYYFLTN